MTVYPHYFSCPASLSHPLEGVPEAVCPPVALELGLRLLCRLFQEWGQVPAGVLILTDWLLGEGEPEVSPVKTPGLVMTSDLSG